MSVTIKLKSRIERVLKGNNIKIRRLVGNFSRLFHARMIFDVNKNFYYYWRKKKLCEGFHSLPHGGVRFRKFSEIEANLIKEVIWKQVNMFPQSR